MSLLKEAYVMRPILATILLLGLTLSTAAAPVGAAGTVTVTLVVDGQEVAPFDVVYGEVTTSAACTVTVAAGANAGDVLDQAVQDGCLDSWAFDSFPDFGRFVTSINGLEGHCDAWPALCSYWRFDVNGQSSDTGIDFYTAQSGDELSFVYDRGQPWTDL